MRYTSSLMKHYLKVNKECTGADIASQNCQSKETSLVLRADTRAVPTKNSCEATDKNSEKKLLPKSKLRKGVHLNSETKQRSTGTERSLGMQSFEKAVTECEQSKVLRGCEGGGKFEQLLSRQRHLSCSWMTPA